MRVSKDLSLAPNNEGSGLSLFSYRLGKRIIIKPDELFPLVEALQAEYEAQQKRYGAAIQTASEGHTMREILKQAIEKVLIPFLSDNPQTQDAIDFAKMLAEKCADAVLEVMGLSDVESDVEL